MTKGVMLVLFFGVFAALFFYIWHLTEAPEAKKAPREQIVCIDAGHGGVDAGALGKSSRQEKDDNLRLAKAVQKACEARGIATMMTRDDDTQVSLRGRCNIANEEPAVLFISLHRNSAKRASANGVEIWTAGKGSGAQLAAYIMDGLKAVGIQSDRGVQQGTSDSSNRDYYVNQHTTMPACLVELGFITNEEDNRLFDEYLESYAEAIADGIEKMLADRKEAQSGALEN